MFRVALETCYRLLLSGFSTLLAAASAMSLSASDCNRKPAATAFIAAVGQQREFETMLGQTKQTVPGLRSIEVELDDTPETGPPGVAIWAHRDDPGPGRDLTDRNWGRWKVETFPPEVCQNFVMLSIYHADGR